MLGYVIQIHLSLVKKAIQMVIRTFEPLDPLFWIQNTLGLSIACPKFQIILDFIT